MSKTERTQPHLLSDVSYWVVSVSGKYKALVRQDLSESKAEVVSGDESCIQYFDCRGYPINTFGSVTFALLRASDISDPSDKRMIQKWTDGLKTSPKHTTARRRRKKRRTLTESEIAAIADSKGKGVKNQFLADKYDASIRLIKKIKPSPETVE